MLTFPLQRKIHPDQDNFIPSHRLIVDAIKRGDANAARKAVHALLVRA
jgi:DNA-binding FadR family transcriptional regulator